MIPQLFNRQYSIVNIKFWGYHGAEELRFLSKPEIQDEGVVKHQERLNQHMGGIFDVRP